MIAVWPRCAREIYAKREQDKINQHDFNMMGGRYKKQLKTNREQLGTTFYKWWDSGRGDFLDNELTLIFTNLPNY